MRTEINGTPFETPKGYVLVATPMIELLSKGDIAIFRDGDQRPVEFVAAMPDDRHADYPNIIAVKGYEPWACTNALEFDGESAHDQDIVGILKSRGSSEILGSSSETQYSVMCTDINGAPKAFIDLNGFEYSDPESPEVYRYTSPKEANHMRTRLVEAGLRPLEDLLVVEIVKEVSVYPVAIESVLEPKAPCPIQEGSILELVDGSVVDVTEVLHSTVPDDKYALGVAFVFGEEEQTLWYDRDGYTNHPSKLHIKRIQLF